MILSFLTKPEISGFVMAEAVYGTAHNYISVCIMQMAIKFF